MTNLHLPIVAASALLATVSAAPHVHHGVHRQLREQGKANIVVTMHKAHTVPSDFESMTPFESRGDKITSMVNALEAVATESQRSIDELLTQETTSSQPLFEAEHTSWALNARLFQGASPELITKLSALSDVVEIREQEVYDISLPPQEAGDQEALNVIEWGVQRIGARQVWADGNVGQGVVVASIDTGVRYTHEAVRRNFRKNYNWYDPDNQSDLPFDNNGHGTHTMGTIAGAKGVGVAPGAVWIACVGCPQRCPEFNLVKCGEFMTCPTDTKGKNRDCSKAPHVINNSWGGSGGRPFYQPVVDAWRAAEIIPVFSQGNNGPACSSAGSPGDYANVIGVGASTIDDALASFSGKGPALNTNLIKPDLSAPGRAIRSSWNGTDTDYISISGTSMAAPHVTGAVALLIAGDKTLTGQFDQIRSLLISTTDQKGLNATGYTCGKTADTTWPNNQYGHGRLNVFGAYAGKRQS